MTWITSKNKHPFPVLEKTAKEILPTLDFPTLKDEEWKYTRLAKLKDKSFSVEKVKDTVDVSSIVYKKASSRLVFENGFFNESLSSINSPYLKTIASLNEGIIQSALINANYLKEGLLTCYNTACFTDGLFLHVPKNEKQEGIIDVIFITSGKSTATVTKNIIILEEGASAEVLFSFHSLNADETLVNHSLHVQLNDAAILDLFKLQNETEKVSHFSSENIHQKNNSKFSIHTLSINGEIVRNDLNISVNGTNCETHLNGVVIANNNMHVDNHTTVDHRKPHCESNEKYKAIAKDNATVVFNGKIVVQRDAQKINAYQNSANVLLSDNANIYSKPELEIYADDVKCSHGTTTGCLDENAVFYLRARGISEQSARNLLIHAFTGEAFDDIQNGFIKEWMLNKLGEKLNSK